MWTFLSAQAVPAVHPAALEYVSVDCAEVLQRSDRQGDYAENGNRRQDVHRGARRHAVEDRGAVPRQRQPLHGDREAERPQEQRAVHRSGAGIAGKANTNIATPSGSSTVYSVPWLRGRFSDYTYTGILEHKTGFLYRYICYGANSLFRLILDRFLR